MSDIVERLNRGEGCLEEGGKTCISMDAESGCICAIAADTITTLRAENSRLRAALSWIDQQRYTDRDTINPDNAFEKIGKLNGKIIAIMDRARAALKGK